jgi:hypothetical protein
MSGVGRVTLIRWWVIDYYYFILFGAVKRQGDEIVDYALR